jgi:hypothetical protein
MKTLFKKTLWVAMIATLVSVLSISAQRTLPATGIGPDTSKNPHDFNLPFYYDHGVQGKLVIWRRDGHDGLSTFSFTKSPIQSNVRVTVTVPAYDQNGQMMFWYPLGEFQYGMFTDDLNGVLANQLAMKFPMYVFPDEKYINYNTIAGTRQAPIIDNTWGMNAVFSNPLGLRELFLVNFTTKAHTKEGFKMMEYMRLKNGTATDGMPIINTVEDIRMLNDEGYVVFGSPGGGPDRGHFAVAPTIDDPTNFVIAKDAFLWMSTRTGKPLEAEMKYVTQFVCLRVTGKWCDNE